MGRSSGEKLSGKDFYWYATTTLAALTQHSGKRTFLLKTKAKQNCKRLTPSELLRSQELLLNFRSTFEHLRAPLPLGFQFMRHFQALSS
jgi:hypothetical protein